MLLKTSQVNFRLSPEQELLLRTKSFNLGITTSEFLRGAIEGFVPNVKYNQELLRINYELRKIGININQIAKVANQTGYINSNYLINYKNHLDQVISKISKLYKSEKQKERNVEDAERNPCCEFRDEPSRYNGKDDRRYRERNRGEISGLPCVPCFYEQDDHPQTETHGSYGDRYCGRGGKTHGL